MFQRAGIASVDDLPVSPDVEVEIAEPPGGAIFEVTPEGALIEISDLAVPMEEIVPWNANLALHCDKAYLDRLATELVTCFEADERARQPWLDGVTRGLELLGLKPEEKNDPWPGACSAVHPLLTEALLGYVADAILETYPPTGPAETSIFGAGATDDIKRAARVKAEMNYQCTVKMPEDRPQLEMTLLRQGLAGCCFRKVFFDPILKRVRRIMVPAEDFVISYGSTDLITSPRYTWRFCETVNEIRKKIATGQYREYTPLPAVPLGSELREMIDEIAGQERTYEIDSEELEMLEMYIDLDLEGFEREDGVAVPYIVTIDRTSNQIVSIYRNHTLANPYVKLRVNFVAWLYAPGFGPYGTGLAQILGGTTDSATAMLRQLVDAGTLANVPAGFKSRNLRIKGDDSPLRPGELRDIDMPPGGVRGNIEWIPTKEPSPVLAQLLTAMVDEGRRVGSVADMKLADQSQGAPVGSVLALLERQLRKVSATQARNNAAMGEELRIMKELIATEMPDYYEYTQDQPASRRQDFASTNIIPVADPSATTQSQRIMRYSAVEQVAQRAPEVYDRAQLHRDFVEAVGLRNADKIVPLADDLQPTDPVTENMRILQMRPVKAFINQDHDAHIAVHLAASQDPLMQQIIGQSPNAPALQAALAAHVQEHVAYAYRARIQQQLGFALPEPDQPLPPELEASISRFVAEAAQKVLAQSQGIAAQQKAQEIAQDPMVQLRMKELAIEELEARAKIASDAEKNAIAREVAAMKAAVELIKSQSIQETAKISKAVDATTQGAKILSTHVLAQSKPKE